MFSYKIPLQMLFAKSNPNVINYGQQVTQNLRAFSLAKLVLKVLDNVQLFINWNSNDLAILSLRKRVLKVLDGLQKFYRIKVYVYFLWLWQRKTCRGFTFIKFRFNCLWATYYFYKQIQTHFMYFSTQIIMVAWPYSIRVLSVFWR